MVEILLLIAGAVISYFVSIAIPRLYVKWQERKRNERESLLENSRLTTWLRELHEHHSTYHHIPNELPHCRIGDYDLRVPYLTKPEWGSWTKLEDLPRILPDQDIILEHAEGADKNFPVDLRLINQRRKIGLEIWNAPTLYLDHITYSDRHPVFHVKTCMYEASATWLIRLENETMNGIRSGSFENCHLRKRYFLTTNGIERDPAKPMTLGCVVVFALKASDGYDIIIQLRSGETLTSNRVTSVTPTFGLSPFRGNPQDKGILYYNFLKEYVEELHNMEELVHEFASRKPPSTYYQWLYGITQAKDLLECSEFKLLYLGFGFNLSNGHPNIGLLALLDDRNLADKIKETIISNWEVAGPEQTNAYEPVKFINYKSHTLEKMFVDNMLEPASAYFLSLALKYLNPV